MAPGSSKSKDTRNVIVILAIVVACYLTRGKWQHDHAVSPSPAPARQAADAQSVPHQGAAGPFGPATQPDRNPRSFRLTGGPATFSNPTTQELDAALAALQTNPGPAPVARKKNPTTQDSVDGLTLLIKIYPNDPVLYAVRASANMSQHKDLEAYQDFRKAAQLTAELRPDEAIGYYKTVATLEVMAAKYKEAAADAAAALQVRGCQGADNVRKALPSIVYWQSVTLVVFRCAHEAEKAQQKARVELLRKAASEIAGLPAVGVDADAVEAGLAIKSWIGDAAEAQSRANDGDARAVEMLVRALNGDPFGAIDDVRRDADGVEKEFYKACKLFEDTRARLSVRYGVEFGTWH